jgi:hypothetical protein
MKRVPELLLEATTIYEERNRLYGNNYKLPVMSLLFPNGIMQFMQCCLEKLMKS